MFVDAVYTDIHILTIVLSHLTVSQMLFADIHVLTIVLPERAVFVDAVYTDVHVLTIASSYLTVSMQISSTENQEDGSLINRTADKAPDKGGSKTSQSTLSPP